MNRLSRQISSAAVAGLLVSGLVIATSATSAQADDGTPFKVVGTTDVSDSGLMANVIEPDFQAANPGIDLQYTPQGTGAAITSAKSGSFSALIVHAASLENQFVAQGYSNESSGRAIFWGDYVLVGPKSDPAGVLSSDPHDIAGAFEKIAAAGAAGNATFVSRGGTPGTTVQEHAIWALTDGVPTCTVGSAQGGGEAPDQGAGGACATTDSGRSYPSWYTVTGAGQAANLSQANLCASGNSNCYAFTDRGTFNYLQSSGTTADNLKIVTRDNANTAAGGVTALVNSFHAYAINPNTVPTGNTVDTATATKFLNFLTSASEQAKIGDYLKGDGGSAFIPSAAPMVSHSALPAAVKSGESFDVKGSITNVVPGTPALNGVVVSLLAKVGDAAATVVGTATTDSDGAFTFSNVTQDKTTTYSVSVPQITDKVEDATLDPPFKDTLQATTQTLDTVGVSAANSSITYTSRVLKGRVLTLAGTISPAASADGTPRIKLFRAPYGKTPVQVKSTKLTPGQTKFKLSYSFPAGRYSYQLQYTNPDVITGSRTPIASITVK